MNGVGFVDTIESLLSERGISKTDFYKYSGVTSASIAQWRSGKYDPSNKAVEKVENFFNIKFVNDSPEYEKLGEQPPYKNFSETDFMNEFKRIFQLFNSNDKKVEQKYVTVPVGTLVSLKGIIDESSEELSSVPKLFSVQSATENQWREQLNKCDIDKLFEIQKTLMEVMQEKTKNASPNNQTGK